MATTACELVYLVCYKRSAGVSSFRKRRMGAELVCNLCV